MALIAVQQENETGCFIAACASLLGKSYRETFAMLHPGKTQILSINTGGKILPCIERLSPHLPALALRRIYPAIKNSALT
jgi:hypothetical protein